MKRFKPAIDKLFWLIWMPVLIMLLVATIIAFEVIGAFILLIGVDLFCLYFLVSSLMGYVELREDTLFIKFGFILKREIPYVKIREINKERRVITYSMVSLKNALEHINIKYNKYDLVVVSVVGNYELMLELEKRMNIEK